MIYRADRHTAGCLFKLWGSLEVCGTLWVVDRLGLIWMCELDRQS
jgi:hypothetical protein